MKNPHAKKSLLGFYYLILGLAFVVSVASVSIAQPAPAGGVDTAEEAKKAKEEEPEPVAKSGEIIASSGSTGRFAAIGVGTIGAAPGDDQSVIGASVSRGKGDSCVAKIINSGKKSYSVSFAVVGKTQSGGNAFRRSFSATVKPGGSVERSVSGCSEDVNVGVVLNSAKALD